MEVEALALLLAACGELTLQCLAVYADSHRRELDRTLQDGVPDQQVAIQAGQSRRVRYGRVVVVVGGAVVVLLAVRQLRADADDKHRTILLADGILALLGRERGVALQELLRVDERDLLGQEGFDLRVGLADVIFGAQNSAVDALNDALEVLHRAAILGHHTLPIPLIDIERVEVIQLLVGADGVHIGDNAVAILYLILGQRHALPLGQRVNHLGLGLIHILDGEGYGALRAAQIVVHTESLEHEQRRRNAAQTQLGRDVGQEEILDLLDGNLSLLKAQRGLVVVRYDKLAHRFLFFIA